MNELLNKTKYNFKYIDLKSIPDDQEEFIAKMTELFSNSMSWYAIAQALNVLPRTFNNYRKAKSDKYFVKMDWRVKLDVIYLCEETLSIRDGNHIDLSNRYSYQRYAIDSDLDLLNAIAELSGSVGLEALSKFTHINIVTLRCYMNGNRALKGRVLRDLLLMREDLLLEKKKSLSKKGLNTSELKSELEKHYNSIKSEEKKPKSSHKKKNSLSDKEQKRKNLEKIKQKALNQKAKREARKKSTN